MISDSIADINDPRISTPADPKDKDFKPENRLEIPENRLEIPENGLNTKYHVSYFLPVVLNAENCKDSIKSIPFTSIEITVKLL